MKWPLERTVIIIIILFFTTSIYLVGEKSKRARYRHCIISGKKRDINGKRFLNIRATLRVPIL